MQNPKMLSKLSSLSIASLRKLAEEANAFYDKNMTSIKQPNFSFRHLKQGIKNFMRSLSWLQLTTPATMLLLFDGFTFSTP